MFVDTSKYFKPESVTYYDPKKDHRVVFLTGATSGIGWYTCLHLYLHGYIVYIASRNEDRLVKTIEDIKVEASKRTENYSDDEKASRPLGELYYIQLDLSDLSTVPKAVEQFGKRENKLDILINNAGLMAVPYQMTKDGYEIQYQVNFVGHLLLTLQLLPFIKESDTTPRIINLSSFGHNFEFKYFHPSEHDFNKFPNAIYTWVRYGKAKVSQIHLTKALASQYPEILSFAVHPGIVFGTGLFDYYKSIPILKYLNKAAFEVSDKIAGLTNEEGSLATLRAAMDPELTLEKDNGSYLVTGGSIEIPSKVATTQENIDETWNWNIEELKKRGFNFSI